VRVLSFLVSEESLVVLPSAAALAHVAWRGLRGVCLKGVNSPFSREPIGHQS